MRSTSLPMAMTPSIAAVGGAQGRGVEHGAPQRLDAPPPQDDLAVAVLDAAQPRQEQRRQPRLRRRRARAHSGERHADDLRPEAEVALHRLVHHGDVGVAVDDDDERVGDVDHLAQIVAVVARLAEEVEVAQRHRELIGERDGHRLVVLAEIVRRRILDVEHAEHLARGHQRHREAARRAAEHALVAVDERTRRERVTVSDRRVRRSAERLMPSGADFMAMTPAASGPSEIIEVNASVRGSTTRRHR